MDPIIISGDIDTWTAENVVYQLQQQKGKDVSVIINNSRGGSYTAGLSIYGALKTHNGAITTNIVGLAGSVSSVIFLAGDEDKRNIAEGSFLMIHNPSGGVSGEAADLKKIVATLEAFAENALDIYESRTTTSRDELKRMMDETTYINAADAVTLGFATQVISDNFEMKIHSLDEYKMQINPKQKKESTRMEDLTQEQQAETAGFFKKLFSKKEDPKMKAADIAETSGTLTMEDVTAAITAANATMKADIISELKPAEVVETQEEAPEEAPAAIKMQASEILEAVEALEAENLTPAARKKAIAQMKAGEFNSVDFLKTADRIKMKAEINEDKQVNHLEEFRSLKGGAKTTYYKMHGKAIREQLKNGE